MNELNRVIRFYFNYKLDIYCTKIHNNKIYLCACVCVLIAARKSKIISSVRYIELIYRDDATAIHLCVLGVGE